MKRLVILFSVLLFTCSSDDNNNPNCNFLFDATVNLQVNTNLPFYSQLAFPGNGVYDQSQGNSGIWLYRATSESLLAWDAADPSQPPTSCSRLVEAGTGDIVETTCDDVNRYSLTTGQGLDGNAEPCTLKPYRVDNLGNGQFLVSNN